MSLVDSGCTTSPCTSTVVFSLELIYYPNYLCIVNFKSIDGKVICVHNELIENLSTNQLYLLKACLADQQSFTSNAHVPFLQAAMPGNLSNLRMLAKTNRILRLYMSKPDFSEQQYKLTRFILNVFAPAWFYTKKEFFVRLWSKKFFLTYEMVL